MQIPHHIRGLAISIVSVCLVAANSGLANTARIPQQVPQDTLITLERTICYGMCPNYRVTIEANGTVTFEGLRFVKTIGKATSVISDQRIRELLAEFDRIGYFDLSDRYQPTDGCDKFVTDSPSAITSIRINGKSKSVNHYYGCRDVPVLADLEKLEKAIDDAVDSSQWIR